MPLAPQKAFIFRYAKATQRTVRRDFECDRSVPNRTLLRDRPRFTCRDASPATAERRQNRLTNHVSSKRIDAYCEMDSIILRVATAWYETSVKAVAPINLGVDVTIGLENQTETRAG